MSISSLLVLIEVLRNCSRDLNSVSALHFYHPQQLFRVLVRAPYLKSADIKTYCSVCLWKWTIVAERERLWELWVDCSQVTVLRWCEFSRDGPLCYQVKQLCLSSSCHADSYAVTGVTYMIVQPEVCPSACCIVASFIFVCNGASEYEHYI